MWIALTRDTDQAMNNCFKEQYAILATILARVTMQAQDLRETLTAAWVSSCRLFDSIGCT